jgi:hypothetical protein
MNAESDDEADETREVVELDPAGGALRTTPRWEAREGDAHVSDTAGCIMYPRGLRARGGDARG